MPRIGPWITPRLGIGFRTVDEPFTTWPEFAFIIDGVAAAAVVGTAPTSPPNLPVRGDPAWAPIILRSEWRPGQVITSPQPALQIYVTVGSNVTDLQISTHYQSPPETIIYRGSATGIPVPLLSGLAPATYNVRIQVETDLDPAHNDAVEAGIVLQWPDYRFIYGDAPALHQRQRPDGLTGPVRSGRGTSTRQGGLYARGIL